MFEVFIWVPTKGWKLVKQWRDQDFAIDMAKQFEPLEVMVSGPHGRVYYGGLLHMPVENLLPAAKRLANT